MLDKSEKKKLHVFISAPSGTGKDSIIEAIITRIEGAVRMVATTTRQKRSGEKHGIDYYFVSQQEFLLQVERGEFTEHNFYAGNYYGTHKDHVQNAHEKGHIAVKDIDVNGVHQLRELGLPNSVFIFISPPDLNALKKRLEGKGRKNIRERLRRAEEEMRQVHLYDHVVVNNVLEDAVAEVEGIIRSRLEG